MKIFRKRNGVVVAEMEISFEANDVYEVAYVRVSPGYRRQGLATELLNEAKQRFKALVAIVDPDGSGLTSEQIKQWFLRHGFKHCWYDFNGVGVRKRALIWKVGRS